MTIVSIVRCEPGERLLEVVLWKGDIWTEGLYRRQTQGIKPRMAAWLDTHDYEEGRK